eukprot:4860194-Prymnesium_polylepis.2
MGEVTISRYGNLGWGDKEMVLVSKVVASGAMAQLEFLYLAENQIGDKGINCSRRPSPAGRWHSSTSSSSAATRSGRMA